MINLGIVGGGLATAMTLYHFFDAAKRNALKGIKLKIDIFEKSKKLVGGPAYNTTENTYLLNVNSGGMSINPRDEDDFVNWLIKKNYCPLGTTIKAYRETYVPRYLYGQYLEESILNLRSELRPYGIYVYVLNNNEIVQITDQYNPNTYEAYFRLTNKNGKKFDYEFISINIGTLKNNLFKKLRESPNYVSTPWPSSKWSPLIKDNSRILVLGTGLTAIDISKGIITLNKNNVKITLASRTGELPRVKERRSYAPRGLSYFNMDRIMDMQDGFSRNENRYISIPLINFLNEFAYEYSTMAEKSISAKKILAHFGRKSDPHTEFKKDLSDSCAELIQFRLIENITNFIPWMWQALSVSDKNKFKRKYQRTWNAWRNAIAPPVAEVFYNFITQRKVAVARGIKDVSVCKNNGFNVCLNEATNSHINLNDFFHKKNGQYYSDIVINCTGASTNISSLKKTGDLPEIIDSLIEDIGAKEHKYGGIEISNRTSNIKRYDKEMKKWRYSRRIFMVGHCVIGNKFYVSSCIIIAKSTKEITDCIIRRSVELETKRRCLA